MQKGEIRMPSKIEILVNKLQDSGKLSKGLLLTKKELDIVEKSFEELKSVKVKRDENVPYSVIKDTSDKNFIVYTGPEKAVASGAQGLLKLAQKCETKELCLVKISIMKIDSDQKYKEKEAIKEAEFLKRKGLLLGFQGRLNDKNEYRMYTFMKILPGVTLCNTIYPPDTKSESLVKYAVKFNETEQCRLLLNFLIKLDELKREGIIHRDLHGGNILIHPVTLEVNIIDFGLALDADANGFCVAKRVSDTRETGPDIRFANGFDILSLADYLPLVIKDKNLLANYNNLKKDASTSETEFNPINLDDAIKEVQSHLNRLNEDKKKKFTL